MIPGPEFNYNFRCDNFTNVHLGKHVLFMGDSFAAGDGLEPEDTWCWKTFQKIKQNEKVSGYYNIGMSGSSIFESVEYFLNYCKNYGNPDVVFFITTEFGRDQKYFVKDKINKMVESVYFFIDQYCKSSNIQLYSFSWLQSIGNVLPTPRRYIWRKQDADIRQLWTEQAEIFEKNNYNFLKNFDTYYEYDKNEMLKKIWEYDKKTITPEKSLWALDLVHPGTSFHDYWAEFIYSKYKIENDNFRNQ